MTTSTQIFTESGNGLIEMIYPPDNGMNAKEIGEAILGMQVCLDEVAKILKIDDLEVIIFPVQHGSFKTIFAYVKKGVIVLGGIGNMFAFLNGGFDLIDRFGANEVNNTTNSVVNVINNPNLVELCKSKNFIYGAQKVVAPLRESVNKVQIKYDDNSFEINCENKDKFFEELGDEYLFPELVDGQNTTIAGEITRINKESSDLGFKYKGRILKGKPLNKEISISTFHEFLDENQVLLTAQIKRSSAFELPELKIIGISKISHDDQLNLFE